MDRLLADDLVEPTSNGVTCHVDFGECREPLVAAYKNTSTRLLYYYLLNVDQHFELLPLAYDLIERHLATTREYSEAPALAPPQFDRKLLSKHLRGLRDQRISRAEALREELKDLSASKCTRLFKQYAPAALIDGCWLQNISNAADSHRKVNACLLRLFADAVGAGDPRRHHGNHYRNLLRSLGVDLPEPASRGFVERDELLDSSFELPVLQLCLSQFPNVFLPELLGLNLFQHACGISPVHAALRARLRQLGANTKFLDLHLNSEEQDLGDRAATAMDAVTLFLEEAGSGGDQARLGQCWERVRIGFAAASNVEKRWLDDMLLLARSPEAGPRERMIELVRRKAPFAFGYHKHAVLGDRTIDDWLDPTAPDVDGMLDALARSRFVIPGDSKASPLLKELTSFEGPMFRIFSPEQLETMAAWIDSLARPVDGGSRRTESRPEARSSARSTASTGCPGVPAEASSLRRDLEAASLRKYGDLPIGELYYYLVNLERYPDILPTARRFAERWLERSRRNLTGGERPIPFTRFTPEGLDSWIEAQHRRQVESYEELTGPPRQTREELIDSSVQLAPTILIDGAWVQNMGNMATSHTPVGALLFNIFYDEVGNGETAINHPNVYRDLMNQMSVDLPEFDTIEFGRWPRFRPAAFQVPVFWLSVSQFTRQFYPEILGLNLAMELSGVGGTYRAAADAMRHYGYSTRFVELHNSIDNVSSGHTAWAAEAIKIHLDEVYALGGVGLAQQNWERVWTGYRALVPPIARWRSLFSLRRIVTWLEK